MANYRDIKGFQIQSLDADPVVNAGAWASGANTNTARRFTPGAGTSGPTHNNVLIFGGSPGVVDTESYDGSSWTELNNLSANKSVGLGTATAALGVGSGVAVEQWNGTSWTEINDISSTRNFSGTQGSTTAALIEGGEAPGGSSALTESYNGSTWSEVNDLNTARYSVSGAGTQTAGLVSGGLNPGGKQAITEQWNGTSWTEVNDLNTSRFDLSGSGSQTQALVYAGNADPPRVTSTESWDGTSWTEINDISTARASANNAGAGTGTTSAVLATGQTPGSVTTQLTEEFSYPPSTSSVLIEGQMYYNSSTLALKAYGRAAGIPSGSWASGAALNTGRNRAGTSASSNSSALFFGGSVPPSTYKDLTEKYNGTAWTEVNEMNTGRTGLVGIGNNVDAGLAVGGYNGSQVGNTEKWNGTSWTEVNDLNTARGENAGGGGTNTSGIIAGGYSTTDVVNSESWDGTSWTETSDLNTARNGLAGAGASNTNALVFGGDVHPTSPRFSNTTEKWDGSSWTEVNELNTGRLNIGGAGVSNSQAIAFGGATDPNSATNTETWNGTSWTEQSELGTASRYMGNTSNGAGVSALCAGGSSSGPSQNETTTQEWAAPITLSTVTTS